MLKYLEVIIKNVYIYTLLTIKYRHMKNLTPLQLQYLQDCQLLQALNYPIDLFDDLYLINN